MTTTATAAHILRDYHNTVAFVNDIALDMMLGSLTMDEAIRALQETTNEAIENMNRHLDNIQRELDEEAEWRTTYSC